MPTSSPWSAPLTYNFWKMVWAEPEPRRRARESKDFVDIAALE